MPTPGRTLGVAALVVLSLVVLLTLTAVAATRHWPVHAVDMWSYVHGGEALRAGGSGLYPPARLPDGSWPYLYAPAFAAVFAGLLSFPRSGAYLVWAGIVFASIVGSLWALRRLGGLSWGRMVLLTTVLALPTIQLVIMGQVDAVVVVLLALALLADRREGQNLPGVLIGLAVVVKVVPALALLPFMILGRWKVARAAVLTATLASLVPLIWLVPELGWPGGVSRLFGLHLEFFDRVILRGFGQRPDTTWMLLPTNASLPGTALRLIGAPVLGSFVMGVLVAVGLWVTAKTRDPAPGVALVVSGAALGNFVFWPHSAFLFALPLAVAFSLSGVAALGITYVLASWVNPLLGTIGYVGTWGIACHTACEGER